MISALLIFISLIRFERFSGIANRSITITRNSKRQIGRRGKLIEFRSMYFITSCYTMLIYWHKRWLNVEMVWLWYIATQRKARFKFFFSQFAQIHNNKIIWMKYGEKIEKKNLKITVVTKKEWIKKRFPTQKCKKKISFHQKKKWISKNKMFQILNIRNMWNTCCVLFRVLIWLNNAKTK